MSNDPALHFFNGYRGRLLNGIVFILAGLTMGANYLAAADKSLFLKKTNLSSQIFGLFVFGSLIGGLVWVIIYFISR